MTDYKVIGKSCTERFPAEVGFEVVHVGENGLGRFEKRDFFFYYFCRVKSCSDWKTVRVRKEIVASRWRNFSLILKWKLIFESITLSTYLHYNNDCFY